MRSDSRLDSKPTALAEQFIRVFPDVYSELLLSWAVNCRFVKLCLHYVFEFDTLAQYKCKFTHVFCSGPVVFIDQPMGIAEVCILKLELVSIEVHFCHKKLSTFHSDVLVTEFLLHFYIFGLA